ncbi:Lrp/AsnC family transcriptional regulator [Sedimenticola selenatireducens]|uniref:Lrp/AsnC family transcriptional regulator n=1 Tax=Sedimenticola selenatireducens TaxID=191960 RepID=A0A557S9K8_9GAMM|nr:Lrp/AsnC family transcriptional regulator [Sedimenticola selenatireducens]TVO74108.1 Lrp/AsnC family transcriptional regulator [Sedimenticola selenatireducens]TVT61628.1 MAG: Lrp/AsnC family transcriptional regulator [Sedimenticola selenatireducens]
MKLDRTDRRILTEMQRDGRISNLELAERVGLSPTPCSRRVKQLEEAGIISRHVTLLNPSKLNLKLIALIQISMDRHTPDRFENFEEKVAQYPEVIECSLITGQTADYLVKVVVPDMDAYQELLLGKITRIAGVSGVQSSFVMRQIISKTELPLDYLT